MGLSDLVVEGEIHGYNTDVTAVEVRQSKVGRELDWRSIPVSTAATGTDGDADSLTFARDDDVHTDGLCATRTAGSHA